jgi:hypothetical protein
VKLVHAGPTIKNLIGFAFGPDWDAVVLVTQCLGDRDAHEFHWHWLLRLLTIRHFADGAALGSLTRPAFSEVYEWPSQCTSNAAGTIKRFGRKSE